MEPPKELEGIRSFPGFSTPTGSIRFGGHLYGTSGTGFAAYRTHGMFALVLVLGQGAGRYRDKLGKDQRVKAGDLIVVFPDLPHQYGPEGDDVWDEVFISFDGAAFEGWRSLGLEPANPVWRLPAENDWSARFLEILEMPLTCMSQATMAANAIHILIADALAARATDQSSIGWLETACRALGGGAGAPSTLEIARNAGLGYENFRKAFKTATGESPGRYRKRMRLAQAALMLKRADLSLEMIAGRRSLGFLRRVPPLQGLQTAIRGFSVRSPAAVVSVGTSASAGCASTSRTYMSITRLSIHAGAFEA